VTEDTTVGMKFVRITFIIAMFNLICAIIAYVTNIMGKTFKYQNWNLTTWWLFISTFIIIGAYMLWKIPFLDRWLAEKLDYQLKRLQQSKEERLKNKKDTKSKKKHVKEQARQQFQSQMREYGGLEDVSQPS